jgi:murein DD-endopeptidase MepM/ murein hydrolase activator NlpD
MFRTLLVSLFLASSAASGVPADSIPWRERARPKVTPSAEASLRAQVDDWPDEPGSPENVERARFERALREVCRTRPAATKELAGHILDSAREFGVDPFLVGALAHRMSRCRPDKEDLGGRGLTLLPKEFFHGHIDGGAYRYHVGKPGSFMERRLPMPRFKYGPNKLFRAAENVYFTAAYLRVVEDQHETLDRVFEQAPHRHHVSHLVWGDSVRGDRAEDRVLTDRRRLLEHYGAHRGPRPVKKRGVELGPPLEGSPRVVSSFPGATRDGGRRKHRGIDLESVRGEPVLAIASGVVTFSGIDFPGAGTARSMPKEAANRTPSRRMGKGGRFVCIRHDGDGEDVYSSCSMHLDKIFVDVGSRVARGERIGTVGRTGIRVSAPHLHLEVMKNGRRFDGSELLADFLVRHPPPKKARKKRAARST